MRNPASSAVSAATRCTRAASVLGGTLLVLLAGAPAALAAPGSTQVRADSGVPFGLLGPVGMVAVAIGILGMAAGIIRSRRKAATGTVPAPAPVENAAQQALAVDRSEETARPPLVPDRRRPAA